MVPPSRLLKPVLLLALVLASPVRADDFDDVVAAERGFAADAAARGARAAFLEVLADDSVVFSPGPRGGRAVWEARADLAGQLAWAPAVAEVAAAGDLAYTSGPWRFTPKGADKPSAWGEFLTVWRKQADGHWKVLLDHGIGHGEVPFPDKVVRRGAIAAGAPPLWPVGLAELRKADLAPPGQVTPAMVSDDFLRLRNDQLPDGRVEGEAIAAATPGRVDSGLVIAQAGDLAVTWGGGATTPSWVRIWRRPVAGDAPGLGWRLAVDMSQPAPTPPAAP